jgi:DNA processing protein
MLGVGRAGAWRQVGPEPAGWVAGTTGTADAGPGALRDDERDAWVVLDSVIGVGPVSFARLIAAFGEARGVLEAARRPRGATALVAASAGLDDGSPTLSRAVADAVAEAAGDPRPALAALVHAGVRAVTLADADYPARLRRIELPPPVLYVAGDAAALDRRRAIAVVGTRRPTAVGRATSARIADAVATLGATVVSGLALGIDAAAHTATLRSGGTTVAVIGGGHLRLYPAAHRGLARAIVARGGAVISEFPPETAPSRGTFPRRNRIISGLADATVVVEAGARSGALTTAAWALEQGRGLHIVPGRLDDPAVAGCLAFLREAGPEARVVAGIGELIEDLGLLPGVPEFVGRKAVASGGPSSDEGRPDGGAAVVLAALPTTEREVAVALAAGRGSVDELVAATGQPGATLLGALTGLELRGLVVETFGRYRPAGALATPGSAPPSGAARAIRATSSPDRRARGPG